MPKRKSSNKLDTQNIVGTLPDWVLKEYIKKGIIKIDPLPKKWEEAEMKIATMDRDEFIKRFG